MGSLEVSLRISQEYGENTEQGQRVNKALLQRSLNLNILAICLSREIIAKNVTRVDDKPLTVGKENVDF